MSLIDFSPPSTASMIRTSVTDQTLDSADVVTAYKNLKHVERDFHIIKADDLDLRPIHHYLNKRVRAHVLICMLAAYLTWHLREALAELTFTDQHIPHPDDPVAPAQRSPQAKTKDATKHTPNELPLHRYKDLLHHLSTLDRQIIKFNGQRIEKITTPTPVQRRVFELLGAPIPTTLQQPVTTQVPDPTDSVHPAQQPARQSRSSKFGLVFISLHRHPSKVD
jgi:hypothetical protein